MNALKTLENRLRGWIPKEPKPASSNLKNNCEPLEASRSWRHYLTLLAISYIILAAIQVILYFLSYINETTLLGGVLVLLLFLPLPFVIWHIQTKYRATKAIQIANRAAFIIGPALIAFPISFVLVFFIFGAERMKALSSYVGYWPTVILLLGLPIMAGALIGYLIGKRRNFEPYR
ncbi:MAG: hypothetical protein NWF05_05145 [Candidatus Bathyarchaeota archaeon]|nr:hypothetical protein [Candidatus Bathyarchaeota archaeon]